MPPSIHFLFAIFLGAAAPVLTLAVSRPLPGEIVLILLSPRTAREAMLADAGGRAIGPGAVPFAMLAHSDDPAFADRLRAAGAWWVADGRRAALLCGAAT